MGLINYFIELFKKRSVADEKSHVEQDRFFEGMMEELVEFGITHSLKFERKLHNQGPAYLFRNPKGGYSGMWLFYLGENNFEIKSSWHWANFDEMKNRYREERSGKFNLEKDDFRSLLTRVFKELLSWDVIRLDKTGKIQKHHSKEEHKRIYDEFLNNMGYPRV